MSRKVEKIVPQEGNPNLAGGVVVNGTTIPCDFVVMGVGVAPATAFLKGSGIELEKDGSIKVDEYLRVKSGKDTKNVYAIGMLCLHSHFVFGLLLLTFELQGILRPILGKMERRQGSSIGM
jgi:NADPH-dependent 2,4-dienoyl-CoA reductase/sulfur reductase-like enzyme